MKKLTALFLALALLCALSACGGEAAAQNVKYGKYVCYQITIGGERITPDGEWIQLDPGGKGRLGISLEVDMQWTLDGTALTIDALGGPYKGTLKADALTLDWGGTMMYFAPEGKVEPLTERPTALSAEESLRIPYTEPTETDAPTEADYSAAYVTDAVTKTLTFEEMALEYHVPEIVFDGEGIDYLNELIYEQLFEGVYEEQVEDALDSYGMPGVAYIVYQWGRSESFLSIVVTVTPYASEGAEFQIYNVDLHAGELASESEVLTHYGYTPDSFGDRAKSVMGSVVTDQYASLLDDPDMKTEMDDLMKRTTSEEYVFKATPFVGADGKLWMVAPIASIAGADYYAQLIPFEDYPISDAYLNYAFG